MAVRKKRSISIPPELDAEIAAAMRQLMEVLKIGVEPSGSTSYAVTKDPRIRFSGQRVGIVLSGGNVDFEHLPWAKSGP